jgi:hypothetical protein
VGIEPPTIFPVVEAATGGAAVDPVEVAAAVEVDGTPRRYCSTAQPLVPLGIEMRSHL